MSSKETDSGHTPTEGARLLEVVQYPHPVLRAKGKPVTEITPEIEQLAKDMLETMYENHGVGLAAQQIGLPLQLTVMDVSIVSPNERPSQMWIDGKEVALEDWMPMTLLNPEIEPLTKEREAVAEACLSLPDISGEVARPPKVKVKADLLNGKKVEFTANGLLARCVQHETDHLHGILIIDRMNAATKASLAGRLKRMRH